MLNLLMYKLLLKINLINLSDFLCNKYLFDNEITVLLYHNMT